MTADDIEEGTPQYMWTLFVDVYCLNYDGNLFDVSLAAVIAALKNSKPCTSHPAQLPTGTVTAEGEVTVLDQLRHLSFNCSPLSQTFSVYEKQIMVSALTVWVVGCSATC